MLRTLNIIFAVMLCLSIVSCKDEEEQEAPSRNCYITSVTLGTLKREIYSQVWDDEQQANKTVSTLITYNAGSFRMAIDQLPTVGTITNPEPLPCNTVLGNVLLTITASGTVTYRSETSYEDDWVLYSATDSVNVSAPLILRVQSTDGSSAREYRLTLNVQKEDPYGFTWTKMKWEAPFKDMDSIKAVWSNEQNALMVLASDATGTQHKWICPDSGNTPTWCDNAQNEPEADAATLTYWQGRFWASTSKGELVMTGKNGDWAWSKTTTPHPMRLIAAYGNELYALRTDAPSMWHADKEMNWTEDGCDTPSMLPTAHAIGVGYTMPSGDGRVMMAGHHYDGTQATVWGKTLLDGQTTQWVHYPWRTENGYPCPALKHMSMTRYNGELVAIGGSLNAAYISVDNGITWKPNYTWSLPGGLSASQPSTIAADNHGRLWLINGSTVYYGRAHTLK